MPGDIGRMGLPVLFEYKCFGGFYSQTVQVKK
jgi:hypothetical protein